MNNSLENSKQLPWGNEDDMGVWQLSELINLQARRIDGSLDWRDE